MNGSYQSGELVRIDDYSHLDDGLIDEDIKGVICSLDYGDSDTFLVRIFDIFELVTVSSDKISRIGEEVSLRCDCCGYEFETKEFPVCKKCDSLLFSTLN